MISEIYILFFKASLTIPHTATVSQKKSGTSKKIQWDFQISRVGSLDFLDLKVNGSPVLGNILCDLDPKVKVKGQILNFLVNVSTPKRLDLATSNFVAGWVT